MEQFKLSDYIEYREGSVTRKPLLQTEGCVTFVLNFQPGQAVPPHKHPGKHVQLHVLSGQLTISCGGKTHIITPEEVEWIHGDEELSIRNDSGLNASVLVVLHV